MPLTPVQARLFADLFDLTGRVAVVTGGLGRLGRQYVHTLARAGAAVAAFDLVGDERAFDGLAPEGATVRAVSVDVTDRAAVEAAMGRVAGELGTATILINNAGVGSSPAAEGRENGPFEDYPEAAWDAMLDSHLKGALFASQAFVRRFRAGGARDGSIVNISSTYGLVSPDQAVYAYRRTPEQPFYKPVGYSVAKSGMLNFTRWLAEYGAPLGIRANTLAPGGVREAGHHPSFVTEYEKRTPLGRMARDEDFNGAVLFLASGASAYMTGALLVVDGGWTAR
jgi:NAD(P)-dependent dehydrogenase (short-subunit alcohol dehydrogenase family)